MPRSWRIPRAIASKPSPRRRNNARRRARRGMARRARRLIFRNSDQARRMRREIERVVFKRLRAITHIKQQLSQYFLGERFRTGIAHQIRRQGRFQRRRGIDLGADARYFPKEPRAVRIEQPHVIRNEQHAARGRDGPRQRLTLIGCEVGFPSRGASGNQDR